MYPTGQTDGRVMGRRFMLTLVIGISAGFSVAYILFTSAGYTQDAVWTSHRAFGDSVRDFDKHPISAIIDHGSDEPAHRDEDRSVADELAQRVRVLCWIMTQPNNHEKKAKHVKATWGKRCNKLIFMSTDEDDSLPSIKLPVKEGRNYLWAKTKEAFRYVYEYHRRDADWFLKADDDTYVVMENLRYMLADYDTNEPIYFGCRFKPFTPQGYMSGGAGYVLSREALDRFVNKALPSPHLCKAADEGAEDAEIGKCLNNIDVKAMDSRDSMNRGRFVPFTPKGHLFPSANKDYWYWKYIYYPTDEGLDCCSDYAVSFHYVNPEEIVSNDTDQTQRDLLYRDNINFSRSHSGVNRSVADELASRVRVLCWVMTHPKTHHTRAQHVKATWGRRCNKLLFMSTVYDKSIPTVKLLVNEGRDYLWAKTKEGFRYVYEQHRSEADWFLKADDDTYVVVENLRYLLHNYSSRDPLYFGCKFKPYVKQGYMAGGAGYVLSREALNLFVNKGLSSTDKCAAVDFGPEDVLMGKCMELIGVKAMDSRDTFGRGRFFPFRPVAHLFPVTIAPFPNKIFG